MPDNVRSFQVEGKVLDIPEDKVSSFLFDMPTAKEVRSFTLGKDTLDIPQDKVLDFIKDMPDAKPLKNYSDTAIPEKTDNTQPKDAVQKPDIGASTAAPEYSIDGKEYPNSKDFLTAVGEHQGKDIKNMVVSNDKETQDKAQKLLQPKTPDDFKNTIAKEVKSYDPYKTQQKFQKEKIDELSKVNWKDLIEKNKDSTLNSELIDQLASGSEKLIAAGYSVPEHIYDFIGAGFRELGVNVPQYKDTPLAKEVKIGKLDVNPLSILEKSKNGLLDRAAENDKQVREINPDIDKGTIGAFANGDVSAGFRNLFSTLTASVPAVMSMMASGGLSIPAQVGAGMALFGGETMNEADKEKNYGKLSRDGMLMVAATTGGITNLFGALGGASAAGSAIKKLIENEGADAAKKAIGDQFKDWMSNMLIKHPWMSPFSQAVSGMGMTLTNNIVDKYSGLKPDINVTDGVADTGLQFLALGAGMGFGIKALKRSEPSVADKLMDLKTVSKAKTSGEDMVAYADQELEAGRINSKQHQTILEHIGIKNDVERDLGIIKWNAPDDIKSRLAELAYAEKQYELSPNFKDKIKEIKAERKYIYDNKKMAPDKPTEEGGAFKVNINHLIPKEDGKESTKKANEADGQEGLLNPNPTADKTAVGTQFTEVKPNIKDYPASDNGMQKYADDNGVYNDKLKSYLNGLKSGTITSKDGKVFTVRETSSKGAVIENENGDTVFRKGAMVDLESNPFGDNFEYKPKESAELNTESEVNLPLKDTETQQTGKKDEVNLPKVEKVELSDVAVKPQEVEEKTVATNVKPKSTEPRPNERLKMFQGGSENLATDVFVDPEIKQEYVASPKGAHKTDTMGREHQGVAYGELPRALQKIGRIFEGKEVDLRGKSRQEILDYANGLDELKLRNENKYGGKHAIVTIAEGSFGKGKKDYTGMIIGKNRNGVTILDSEGVEHHGKTYKEIDAPKSAEQPLKGKVDGEVIPEKGQIKDVGEVITDQTEVEVKKELSKEQEDKSPTTFKEQRVKLLSDLNQAKTILSDENIITGDLSKEQISDLKKLGIEVVDHEFSDNNFGKEKKQTLKIDVYKDGTIYVGDIDSAIKIIEKRFPKSDKKLPIKIENKTLADGKGKDTVSEVPEVEKLNKSIEDFKKKNPKAFNKNGTIKGTVKKEIKDSFHALEMVRDAKVEDLSKSDKPKSDNIETPEQQKLRVEAEKKAKLDKIIAEQKKQFDNFEKESEDFKNDVKEKIKACK